jgi:hypothetical protein
METCTGQDIQLWRVEPGDAYASKRFKAETAPLCLAAHGGSGSSVVAEVCEGSIQVYLPGLLKNYRAGSVSPPSPGPAVTPHDVGSGQDFYLIRGGQVRLPGVAGGPQYCFDVHDVWDSQFTSGQGGPAPGQRVQIFECYTSQLNQRWNLTGDITSVGKCLTMSGDATANGAPATVGSCDDSAVQDWDYYW